MLRLLALVGCAALAAIGCATAPGQDDVPDTEDELVATFDRTGHIDLEKTTRILIVGDSDELGTQPLKAAASRARRYAELYPNDQIVLFVTKENPDAAIMSVGATMVEEEPFPNVTLSDLRRLSGSKLVSAMDRFVSIASIDFYGHSSPFAALTEASGSDRSLSASAPSNMRILADNFARDRNPYVTLNGCNGGVHTAPELSRLWRLPVSGALTASNFQVLMDDSRWYPDDPGRAPPDVHVVRKNSLSYREGAPACSTGACLRMKPEDAPYWGVWSSSDIGFQFGLNYYKFFCDYPNADSDGSCARGMTTSLYAFPSVKAIDAASSEADVRTVLGDYFCNAAKDPTWFERCTTGLFAALESGAAFSPMKGANDYSLECDFAGCEQSFRCDVDENGTPQKGSCVWVNGDCPEGQAPQRCRSKNTTKQTTNRELRRFLDGHGLLQAR
jgi:hypothetical protein